MATSPLSQAKIVLEHGFYPKDCVTQACKAYRDLAVIAVEAGSDSSAVEITSRSSESQTRVRREFLNYVLDLSIKAHLSG